MTTTGGVSFGWMANEGTAADPSPESLRACIDRLNKETACYRHEAQQARSTERQAHLELRQRDDIIRALNIRLSSQEAELSTLRARLAAHLLIEDGYRRLTALYAGQAEGPQ